jgi:predicted unusual protein kinase regulating ubiquinone biosynthesis (AarF/ABC1/UbiB family)
MTIDREAIKRKIKNLLARNTENGATEAEAEVCLRKANKLLEEFNIELEEILMNSDKAAIQEEPVDVACGIARTPEFKVFMNAIAKLYDCQTVIRYRYQGSQRYRSTYFTMVGTVLNIEYTNYMIQQIIDIMEECYKQYVKSTEYQLEVQYHSSSPRRIRNSFVRGFLKKVTDKAWDIYWQKQNEIKKAKEDAEKQNTKLNNSYSLVVLNNNEVKQYITALVPKAVSISTKNYGKADIDYAKNAGSVAGNSVHFGRPVNGGNQRLLKG